MIYLDDIEFTYPRSSFCLRIPQLNVPSGRQVAVVGPSGSGKTTFLSLLAGILLPRRGRVVVGDREVQRMSDAQRRLFRISHVGFVFQNFELIDYLNVHENMVVPYLIQRQLAGGGTAWAAAAELAGELGLSDLLRRDVQQLSQGEKQRVAICRALVTQPRVVLADEPTGNLDPDNKTRIVHLLHERARKAGATLIMVTHDRELLAGFDEVIDFQQWISATAGAD